MVMGPLLSLRIQAVPLPTQTGSDQAPLPDPTRAYAILILIGIIAIGTLTLALIWVGGRFIRRYMNTEARNSAPSRNAGDDWK